MSDKTAVVTGATSGIGEVCVHALAEAGYRLILPCRNRDKGVALKQSLAAQHAGADVQLLDCDMAQLASVRDCARQIAEAHDSIDLLINNAGLAPLSLQLTADDIELGFAVNHLSHFVLTRHLLPALQAGAGARIVHTSSEAAWQGDVGFMDDINYDHRRFRFFKAYGNSKLANMLFSNRLARELDPAQVTSNAFHPGRVATGIWPDSKWYEKMLIVPLKKFYLISPEQGARPMIKLALDEDMAGVTGKFYWELRDKSPVRQSQDPALQDKLWDISSELAQDFLPA